MGSWWYFKSYMFFIIVKVYLEFRKMGIGKGVKGVSGRKVG